MAIIAISIALIFLFFPKKYESEIDALALKYNLSPYLIASVINIESGYDERALSDAGAMGLMQILPSTAEDCASRLDIDYNKEDLYSSQYNMEIGCYYINYLMEMFEGNITNVLASYNWGLGNVKSWMNEGNIDENGTIINIPVKETRDYLKKFNINRFVYKNLYGYN